MLTFQTLTSHRLNQPLSKWLDLPAATDAIEHLAGHQCEVTTPVRGFVQHLRRGCTKAPKQPVRQLRDLGTIALGKLCDECSEAPLTHPALTMLDTADALDAFEQTLTEAEATQNSWLIRAATEKVTDAWATLSATVIGDELFDQRRLHVLHRRVEQLGCYDTRVVNASRRLAMAAAIALGERAGRAHAERRCDESWLRQPAAGDRQVLGIHDFRMISRLLEVGHSTERIRRRFTRGYYDAHYGEPWFRPSTYRADERNLAVEHYLSGLAGYAQAAANTDQHATNHVIIRHSHRDLTEEIIDRRAVMHLMHRDYDWVELSYIEVTDYELRYLHASGADFIVLPEAYDPEHALRAVDNFRRSDHGDDEDSIWELRYPACNGRHERSQLAQRTQLLDALNGAEAWRHRRAA